MHAETVAQARQGQAAAARRKLAFLYEHPHWFTAIFAELSRRGVEIERILVPGHFYDLGAPPPSFKVLFNRMSPSADSRGHGSGIFHTLAYLEHLERIGVRVINGARSYRCEISKAGQGSLLQSLGLPFIPTRVIHAVRQAPEAAQGLRFPVIVKAGIGGSGKGITRFDTPVALVEAADGGNIDLGYDRVALVQEFVPARGGFITRVETLGGRFLYAIRVHLSGETFDLCPADICRTTAGQSLNLACPAEASKVGLTVEAFLPPSAVIAAVERIVQAAGIDVGGVEYLTDDRDGATYYYDINALSNFVADAPRVIGFDPVQRLGDFLEDEIRRAG